MLLHRVFKSLCEEREVGEWKTYLKAPALVQHWEEWNELKRKESPHTVYIKGNKKRMEKQKYLKFKYFVLNI